MIELSDNAKKALEKYLQQVRACLQGYKTIDANEIEQNVMEHIENEFAAATDPVSVNQLSIVLDRLGSPAQWIPQDQEHRNTRVTQSKVLIYISSALMAAFVLLSIPYTLAHILWGFPLPAIIFFPRNLLLASFILARVALHRVWAPKDLDWQRWLAYPSLVLVYIAILWRILFFAAIMIRAFWLPRYMSYLVEIADGAQIKVYETIVPTTMIASVGLWWMALGIILRRRPNLVRLIFSPFANWFDRKCAVILLCAGLVIAAISAGMGVWQIK
ncbi:MAG: hypothetical protein ACYSTF_06195 [Planctomycetota bacterium]|jgi:hypothetical protein